MVSSTNNSLSGIGAVSPLPVRDKEASTILAEGVAEASTANRLRGRITLFRNWLLALPSLGFAIQMIIAPTRENATASLLAALGSIMVCYDACRYTRFISYPLSTIILLGFGIILNLLPLLVTPIEGKAIIYNLELPEYTFFHCLLVSSVAIIAHATYRHLKVATAVKTALQALLIRMGIFSTLRYHEMILFSLLGILAVVLQTDLTLNAPDTPLVKFIEGFRFLSWAPVIYYLQSLWSTPANLGVRRIRWARVMLLLYSLLIIVVAISTNKRVIFIGPLSTLLFGLLIAALYGVIRVRRSHILAGALAIIFIIPLLSDMGSAMRMVRQARGDVPRSELISMTMQALQNREDLRRFQQFVNEQYQASTLYDEVYYDNEMLNRLANIKYVDQSLELSHEADQEARKEMFDYHFNHFLSELPTPLFTALGLPADLKNKTIEISFGDKQLFTILGYDTIIGQRATSFIGVAMQAFGYSYLLILLVGLVISFTFADSHVITWPPTSSRAPVFSIIGFSYLLGWFVLAGVTNNINTFYTFALRDFWQPVLLLFLSRWCLARL